jgi:hypothetical protein
MRIKRKRKNAAEFNSTNSIILLMVFKKEYLKLFYKTYISVINMTLLIIQSKNTAILNTI